MKPKRTIQPEQPARELPFLRTFAVAAELTNFSAAARQLGMTQSAVSQQMHALERELQAPLFERHGGRVQLTDAGRTLYEYADRIGQLHGEARARVAKKQPRASGELVLAASSIPGEYVLPKLLAAFRKKHPDISVRVTIADSDAVLSLVAKGNVHLGFTGKRPSDSQFASEPFAEDELVLVIPSRHPWASKQRINWDQAASSPLIVRERGSGARFVLEQAIAHSQSTPREPNVTIELGSNEAIKEAVRRGLGLAVLSIHSVQKERKSGRLHIVHIQGLDLKRRLYLVRDRRRVLSLPERLLLDFLRSQR